MLRSYTVRGLRGSSTAPDQSDARQGFFQRVEGLLPYPEGAFTSPAWDGRTGAFDGIDDSSVISAPCKSAIETALSGEDDTKSHFVRLRFGGTADFDIICCWSMVSNSPLLLCPVYPDWKAVKLDEEGAYKSPVNAAPAVTLLASDFNASLPWYASRIADRIYFGNGTDQNQRYIPATTTFEELDVRGTPAYRDNAQVDFPPCKVFAMGGDREIYATGNVTTPLRVWTTDKPGSEFGIYEGVRNLETSYTDITRPGATKITAISVWNNYVTVHTDAGCTNLFGHNTTTDGYKSNQGPSAVAAGAPNQDCVKDDSDGYGSYYIGDDNQLYKDEAVRGSPFNKRYERRIDSPVAMFDKWNSRMETYADGDYRNVIYDRHRGLTYIWAKIETGQNACWCYNEATGGITGPVTLFNPAYVTSVIMEPTGYTMQIGMSSDGTLYFDTGPNETTIPTTAASVSGLGFSTDALDLTTKSGFAVATKQTTVPAETYPAALFSERIDGDLYRKVFGHNTTPSGSSPYDASFSFLGDYSAWSMLDTGFIDLGDDTVEKTFREVRISIDRGNPVSPHVLLINDHGHHRIVSREVLSSESQHVFRFTLRGRRVRIVALIGYFISRPITLRAFELRYLPGRARSR